MSPLPLGDQSHRERKRKKQKSVTSLSVESTKSFLNKSTEIDATHTKAA
jgi:hypothetical protein